MVWHTIWTLFKYNMIHLVLWLFIVCVCDGTHCNWLCTLCTWGWRRLVVRRIMWTSTGLMAQLLQLQIARTLFVFCIVQIVGKLEIVSV